MNGKSSAELEQEAEDVRAQVTRTAESLRERMTPGQLLDEAMNYFRESDSALAVDNLKHQVRDNPLALALVGTGLVWLMTGSGPRSRSDGADYYGTSGSRRTWRGYAAGDETFTGETSPDGWSGRDSDFSTGDDDHGRSMTGRASDAVRDTAHSVSSSAAGLGRGIGDSMSRTGHSAMQAGRSVQREMGSAADYTRRTFSDLLEREPLVLGAIGMAVGAAIGAMLPSTRFEDEHFGEARDHLKDDAKEMFNETVQDAKDVASEAYAASRSTAEDEGLVPHDEKPLAERLSSAVEAGAKAAEEKTEEKFGRPTSDSSTSRNDRP